MCEAHFCSAGHEPGEKMRKLNRRKKDAVGENL